ncbi:glycosyltransferase family 4 protein [Cohnella sp. AR92]|uniref:glycosyltransferase family 4 protein n=1 Tax=Cohnella sp. AR92 TaxID=648716 RepID=UPI000F8DF9F9|nr:glycosyltransferase family 4 protein [Cohnella sp. AR92]RUS42660.1 glycosyltransferase [Cohnella sp. AR92]
MGEPTVYMWPKKSPHNKYSELLSDSIERQGQHVEHYGPRSVLKPRKGDVVHFHWPSYTYQASVFPLTIAKSSLFLLLLLLYKGMGVRLYWTVHNIWPHTGKSRWDAFMRRRILNLCDSAFALSESVRQEAVSVFGVPEEKLVVTPHGHYLGAYPESGADIRARFGIPKDRFLFLFVGRINPYKGVEQLVAAYRSLPSEACSLLIAGQADAGYGLDFIDAANDGTIKVHPSFVDDGELADYLRAADAVVLPYRQITTSGSAILALSYKKPVVAPNLGSLGEYVPEGGGVLYDPEDPEGLRKALLASMKLNKKAAEERISDKLKELDWDRIAGRMLRAYAGAVPQEVNA